MRAARLHDVVELGGLPLERRGERLERGKQVVRELAQRGEVHRGREDVVRRLAHVHVVVRVDVLAGERRDDLVRVHVRARARPGLEDVDRELVVELARGNAVAGSGDAIGELPVEQLEVGVRARRCGLDPPQPARDRSRDRLARDREVGDRLLGLATPESLLLGRLRHRGESSAGRSDCLDGISSRSTDAQELWTPAGTYLNTASYGLPPTPAWDALQGALEDWRGGRTSWEHWGVPGEAARASFARLVGVPVETVAIGANVSTFVGLVAASIPDGSRVLAPDVEFTSLLFPFLVQEHRGVTVRLVPAAELVAEIGPDVDVVAFSAVQMATGEVADLDASPPPLPSTGR